MHGRKASRFVHGRRYGVRTHGRSRPRLAGLLPLMGKATVSNLSVPPPYCRHSKSPCYGLLVGCGEPARDSSLSLLPVLSACTITATTAGTLLSPHPPRSFVLSSVTPSRGIALPPCLVSTTLDRCNYRRDCTFMVTNVGPQVPWFSLVTAITNPPPQALSGFRDVARFMPYEAALSISKSLTILG